MVIHSFSQDLRVSKQKALPRPLTNVPRSSKDGSIRNSSDVNELTLWLQEELKKVYTEFDILYAVLHFNRILFMLSISQPLRETVVKAEV